MLQIAEHVDIHVLQHPTKYQVKLPRGRKLWQFEV